MVWMEAAVVHCWSRDPGWCHRANVGHRHSKRVPCSCRTLCSVSQRQSLKWSKASLSRSGCSSMAAAAASRSGFISSAQQPPRVLLTQALGPDGRLWSSPAGDGETHNCSRTVCISYRDFQKVKVKVTFNETVFPVVRMRLDCWSRVDFTKNSPAGLNS